MDPLKAMFVKEQLKLTLKKSLEDFRDPPSSFTSFSLFHCGTLGLASTPFTFILAAQVSLADDSSALSLCQLLHEVYKHVSALNIVDQMAVGRQCLDDVFRMHAKPSNEA